MQHYDFESSVGYWLTITYQAYIRALNDEFAPEGITYRQAQVIGWLAVAGPLSQAELSSRMMIEPPSLVGTLNRMEAHGLLERCTCPADRRKNLVHLLPGAKAVWKRMIRIARRVRSTATAGLSDREVATLERLLTKIRTNVAPPQSTGTVR